MCDEAWAAGLFDGEGSICWTKERTPQVHICCYNGCLELLQKLQRIWGGSIIENRKKPGGLIPYKNPVYRWEIYQNASKLQFLEDVSPYLITKREKVLVTIAFLTKKINIT